MALGLWTHSFGASNSPRPGQLQLNADEEAANCQLDDVLESSEYFKELISLLLSVVLLGNLRSVILTYVL